MNNILIKKSILFGDSHTGSFSENLSECVGYGFPIGPLGYNLIGENLNEIGKWGEYIFSNVYNNNHTTENTSAAILVFGEIDIRVWVIKKMVENNLTLEESVKIVTDRIINFSKMFYDRFQIPVLIFEPVASTMYNNDPSYPEYGSVIDRNRATELASLNLKHESLLLRNNGYKIWSFGIFNKLHEKYLTKVEFYKDPVHLNSTGSKMAIQELQNICSENNIEIL